MSTESWLLVAVAATSAAASWMIVRGFRRRLAQVMWRLPEAIRGETLAYAERQFHSGTHPRIVARVDRAYRSRHGLITLVELKTRRTDRVHTSDIVQLSAQRLALEAETGEPVAPTAFVAVQSIGGLTWRPVGLMSSVEVMAFVQRREALVIGQLAPRPPSRPELCAACVWKDRCDAAYGRVTDGRTKVLPSRRTRRS